MSWGKVVEEASSVDDLEGYSVVLDVVEASAAAVGLQFRFAFAAYDEVVNLEGIHVEVAKEIDGESDWEGWEEVVVEV